MNESAQLEREAVALYRSIPTWARSASMRDFLRRLAAHLNWQQLTEELK